MLRVQRANPILAISLIAAAMLVWAFYRAGQPDRSVIQIMEHGDPGDVHAAIAGLASDSSRADSATMREIQRIACDPSMPMVRRRYAVTAIFVANDRSAIGPLLAFLEKEPWTQRHYENLPSVTFRALTSLGDSSISPTMARFMNRLANEPNPDPLHAMSLDVFAQTHPHGDFASPLCRLADRLAASTDPDANIGLEVTLTTMTFQPPSRQIGEHLTRWMSEHPDSSLRTLIEPYLHSMGVKVPPKSPLPSDSH